MTACLPRWQKSLSITPLSDFTTQHTPFSTPLVEKVGGTSGGPSYCQHYGMTPFPHLFHMGKKGVEKGVTGKQTLFHTHHHLKGGGCGKGCQDTPEEKP